MSANRLEQMKEYTRELNILVVEDNKLLHNTYKKMLSGYFREYHTAMDGLEGLKMYQENPSKYDIIISDHQMPNMDGLEMIREIKAINKDTNILFVTGTSDISILSEVSLLSIDAIITKPLNTVQLLSKIDDISTQIIEKRHMQLYVEQLEQMNQAVWNFKEMMRKKIKLLSYIPAAKGIHAELEMLINKPISLLCDDNEEDREEMVIHTSDEIEEDFDVEKAMREYGKKEPNKESLVIAEDEESMHAMVSDESAPEGRFKDIRYSVVDKISAQEFVSEIDEGTFSELDDFREDLDNFNLLLNDMSLCEPSQFYGYLDQVSEFYHRLFQTVNSFVVFSAIENTFKQFASFIENISREQLEDIDKQNLLVDALFALSDDLSKWINIVFYEMNTDNIHYFDASFANTCLEIEAMFNEEEAQTMEEDEDLLEFF